MKELYTLSAHIGMTSLISVNISQNPSSTHLSSASLDLLRSLIFWSRYLVAISPNLLPPGNLPVS